MKKLGFAVSVALDDGVKKLSVCVVSVLLREAKDELEPKPELELETKPEICEAAEGRKDDDNGGADADASAEAEAEKEEAEKEDEEEGWDVNVPLSLLPSLSLE